MHHHSSTLYADTTILACDYSIDLGTSSPYKLVMKLASHTLAPKDLVNEENHFYRHEQKDYILLSITAQLMNGLAHLHHLGVFHRDIKPENVLFYGHCDINAKRITLYGGEVRITDFGASRLFCKGDTRCFTTSHVTVGYRAPEILVSKFYNEKVDVFAAAITMLEIMDRLRAHDRGERGEKSYKTRFFDTLRNESTFDEIMRQHSLKLANYREGIMPIWKAKRNPKLKDIKLDRIGLHRGADYGDLVALIEEMCPKTKCVLLVSS